MKTTTRKHIVQLTICVLLIELAAVCCITPTQAADPNGKYSMTYVFSGTIQQQIKYVERTNNSLHTLSPSWFNLNPDGNLKSPPISTELVNRMHTNKIKVVPFLSNHWDRTAGTNALKNIDRLSTQIANYIAQYDLDGVNVDIENVLTTQRNQYTELVRMLRTKIPANKEVSVAVGVNPWDRNAEWVGPYDYTALAKNSDYLMLMAYDEHYEGGPAGPVASISFAENSIKYALSKTSADKIVLGIPFFGRIWSVNSASVVGKGVSTSTINDMIRDYNAIVTFDSTSQSPKAEFEVKTGDKQYTIEGKVLTPGKYVVWYENDQSLQAKLNLVQKYNLKGAGSWALGQEEASIWNNYTTWLNGETSPALSQQLKIPQNNGSVLSAVQPTYLTYTIKSGDTLWLLAQRYGTTVNAIKTLNGLTSNIIYPGQKLQIPQTN
ncbi:MAG: LysM peptidoglycan-binding domain-containing protein [Nitrososphaerota archaeon]|jgi:spore germination protein YaaH|nr:LysM peptidoglycan-binding domain-containing protein [Nitrososphaerota archaeon]